DGKVAADAVGAASHPHHFLSVTKGGGTAIVATRGNPDSHVILRGGRTPNYDAGSVQAASEVLERAGLVPRIMIDASHANSGKNPENQPAVVADVAAQVAAGERRVIGPMVERSEEHTSELQSRENLVCRLLLEKKKEQSTR